ncbi:MAG: hypothetical protein ABIQ99_08875 [Thermoflexales bacterium]
MPAVISLFDRIEQGEVLALYIANHGSSAEKPAPFERACQTEPMWIYAGHDHSARNTPKRHLPPRPAPGREMSLREPKTIP